MPRYVQDCHVRRVDSINVDTHHRDPAKERNGDEVAIDNSFSLGTQA